LFAYGQPVSPRGQKILELENYQFTMEPYERLTTFEARGLNLQYCKAEFLWYLGGDRFDESIAEHAIMWKKLKDVDGGFNSQYGQYIFGDAQFHWVLDELRRDIDSRRAVMVLLQGDHLREDNVDVVCTYGLGFRIRNNKLNMSVTMRSNDAIFGMTNDVFCFSMIQEMVLENLKRIYPDLEMGTYCHKVDSLHVYERHFEMLEILVTDGERGIYNIDIPRASSYLDFQFLQTSPGQPAPENLPLAHWLTHNV